MLSENSVLQILVVQIYLQALMWGGLQIFEMKAVFACVAKAVTSAESRFPCGLLAPCRQISKNSHPQLLASLVAAHHLSEGGSKR